MQNELPFDHPLEKPTPETEILNLSEFEEPEEILPFDCGRHLARQMLQAAMGKALKILPFGLYIIVAPGDQWCRALKHVVRDIYLGPLRRRRHRMDGANRSLMHVFELPSTSDQKSAERMIAEVQVELEHGKTAFVIAGDITIVPAALQLTSDRTIMVPPPRRQWLSALIREIAPNTRRLSFRGLDCETLTPTGLCLAYRPNTSAHAFVRRLQALTPPPSQAKVSKFIPLIRLHGVDEAKRWAADLKADLTLYRQGQLAWQDLSRGLLLSGSPGTAKTTLAGSIADYCGLAFVSTSYAAWQRSGSGHLGDVLKAMAAAFTEARTRAPALLFFDEIDTVGSRGQESQRGDWWRSIINALLEQMDGSIDNQGVIFVGASNHPHLIDPAIRRSGRMEDHIALGMPSVEALASIYRDQLEGISDETINWPNIGRISAGMTGADVVRNCSIARRRARNAGRPVTYDDVLAAIAGDNTNLRSGQQLRVAIHEAGHAIATLAFPKLELSHAMIVGQGSMGGGTGIGLKADTQMTPTVLDAFLTALLSGRAAEEIMLGEISAGAGGHEGCDLSRATILAAEAELSLGMRMQGLIWYAPPSVEKLARLFAQRPDLERAVREQLDRAYARARELIKLNKPVIRKLAGQLLEHRVMSGEEIKALVRDAESVDPLPEPEHIADSGWLQ